MKIGDKEKRLEELTKQPKWKDVDSECIFTVKESKYEDDKHYLYHARKAKSLNKGGTKIDLFFLDKCCIPDGYKVVVDESERFIEVKLERK